MTESRKIMLFIEQRKGGKINHDLRRDRSYMQRLASEEVSHQWANALTNSAESSFVVEIMSSKYVWGSKFWGIKLKIKGNRLCFFIGNMPCICCWWVLESP